MVGIIILSYMIVSTNGKAIVSRPAAEFEFMKLVAKWNKSFVVNETFLDVMFIMCECADEIGAVRTIDTDVLIIHQTKK